MDKKQLENKIQQYANTFYDRWSKNTANSGMEDMLGREDCSEQERICVSFGKFNQQVTNGGHIQWYDNKYFEDTEEYLLKYAAVGIELSEDHKDATSKKVFEHILDACYAAQDYRKDIQIIENEGYPECWTCDGNGFHEDEDTEGNITYVDCDVCGGTGYHEEDPPTLAVLDKRYYEFKEEEVFKAINLLVEFVTP